MSPLIIPETMKALVTQSNKTAVVQEIPVPTIDDNEILVQTVAVALNPTDWKFIETVSRAGTICGCDWSGYVVQKGENVTTLKIGDRVAGFVQGGTYTDRGAYAEYVKTTADLAWKIPAGTVSDEEAATFGCADASSIGSIQQSKRSSTQRALGSTGMFALQLAKLAGYKIVSTCSPRNFELVKSLGADVVVDYNDPDASKKIAEATGYTIHKAFDTISEASSQKITIQAFAPGPGKIIATCPPVSEAQALRDDVPIQQFTVWGQHFPASVEDKQHMACFLTKVSELVRTGAVEPNRTKLCEGGLKGINDGLRFLKEGKNSGKKIVYRLKESERSLKVRKTPLIQAHTVWHARRAVAAQMLQDISPDADEQAHILGDEYMDYLEWMGGLSEDEAKRRRCLGNESDMTKVTGATVTTVQETQAPVATGVSNRAQATKRARVMVVVPSRKKQKVT
ncbi:hypothetical protein EIP86_000350 [Pleurotus ostreatoroseus]|nr:hypothetical protein EIP86_000350 [Pleurotus ostreatoroseus]